MKTKTKEILFLFVVLFVSVALANCTDSKESTNEDAGKENIEKGGLAEISFTQTVHDFGKVTEGEKVGWYFYFTNTGGQDLIIQNVSSSCGCTVPDYSKEPVPPGGEGSIKVIYNSTGRNGFDTKYVTVVSNASESNLRLSN